jgi:hypothetical protein
MAEVELPNVEELEEVKSKKFTRRVALVTAIYAVLLAITSLGGSNAMKEMLLAQQQSSDQWAFYQAKAIREHLYRIEKSRLEVDLVERGPTLTAEARDRYQSLAQKMGEEERRFQKEKAAIEKQAKELEAERDLNRQKDPYFDFAEVLLQIAIIMASVSILSGSRITFIASLVAASLGGLLSLNGFFLWVRIPFLG